MTDDRSLERAARSWLETGPTQAPDRAVESALLQIETTSQERDLRISWRLPSMTTPARAATAAVIAVLLVGGVFVFVSGSSQPAVGGPTTAAPQTPAPTPTSAPTSAPSSARAAPSLPPLSPSSTLSQYTSSIYAYTIGYPTNWQTRGATVALAMGDYPDDTSVAVDYFGPSANDVRTGGLIVAGPSSGTGTTLETWVVDVEKMKSERGNILGWAHCAAPDAFETIQIGGGPGRLLTWQACPTFELWAATVHAGRAYHLVWVDDQASGNSALQASDLSHFRQILASLSFTTTK